VYPEVFQWGFLHVRSYGLLLAVAFLVGTWLGLKEARRRGLDEDKLVSVIVVTLIASILGARVLYVLEHIEDYRGHWGGVLAVWQGGLTLYGGIIAGTLAGLWTARRMGMPMWQVADSLAPSIALGTAFGRVGCYLNGCCYGKPTGASWGVVYPPDSFAGLEFGEVHLHPAQLYFAAAGLVLFLVLWILRKRLTVPGHLFWTFVLLFTLVRVGLDFFRAYEPGTSIATIGGLEVTESQLVSLAMALFAVLMIFRLGREKPAAPVPATAFAAAAPAPASSPAAEGAPPSTAPAPPPAGEGPAVRPSLGAGS
jgi:phosphatidylglycerol:prolipoprotein diacylglycerol transferase